MFTTLRQGLAVSLFFMCVSVGCSVADTRQLSDILTDGLEGHIKQPGAGGYDVKLRREGDRILARYIQPNCDATYVLIEDGGADRKVYRADIVRGKSRCVGGHITLRRSNDDWRYEFRFPGKSNVIASGLMTPIIAAPAPAVTQETRQDTKAIARPATAPPPVSEDLFPDVGWPGKPKADAGVILSGHLFWKRHENLLVDGEYVVTCGLADTDQAPLSDLVTRIGAEPDEFVLAEDMDEMVDMLRDGFCAMALYSDALNSALWDATRAFWAHEAAKRTSSDDPVSIERSLLWRAMQYEIMSRPTGDALTYRVVDMTDFPPYTAEDAQQYRAAFSSCSKRRDFRTAKFFDCGCEAQASTSIGAAMPRTTCVTEYVRAFPYYSAFDYLNTWGYGLNSSSTPAPARIEALHLAARCATAAYLAEVSTKRPPRNSDQLLKIHEQWLRKVSQCGKDARKTLP